MRMVRGLAALLLCATITTSSVNAQAVPAQPWRAQMEEAERPPAIAPPEPERRWYGWQTLAVDAASIALVLIAGVTDTTSLGWTGGGVWLAGAPIVHLANEQGDTAAISLGIRATAGLLVVGGGALVLPAFDDTQDTSRAAAAAGGILVLVGIGGMAAAVAIDAAMLAFEEESSSARALRVMPWIDLERGRGGARLSLPL